MGSFQLTTKKPLLNGRIDTIEKLSGSAFSNQSLDSANVSPQRRLTNSKFSSIAMTQSQGLEGGDESPSKNIYKKKNLESDLHKKAIINSLSKGEKAPHEEEKKSKK